MRWTSRALRALALVALPACALPLFGMSAAGAQAPGDQRGLPADSGSGRRVVYSVEQQHVWWVEEDGTVVNDYLVSGRAGTPDPGTYSVYSKSRHTSAIGGGATMEFMIRFAWGNSAAIGFHSIPVDRRGRQLQSEDELGSPRSHGCVRQRYSDAAALWDWAGVGTQVVVVK